MSGSFSSGGEDEDIWVAVLVGGGAVYSETLNNRTPPYGLKVPERTVY